MAEQAAGFSVVETVKNSVDAILPLIQLLDVDESVQVSHVVGNLQTRLLSRIQDASLSSNSSARDIINSETQDYVVCESSQPVDIELLEESSDRLEENVEDNSDAKASDNEETEVPTVRRSTSIKQTQPVVFESVESCGSNKLKHKNNTHEVDETSVDDEAPCGDKACKDCGKEFPYEHMLKRHLVVHTKVEVFNCDICCQGFTRVDNLKRHRLICAGKLQSSSQNESVKENVKFALKKYSRRRQKKNSRGKLSIANKTEEENVSVSSTSDGTTCLECRKAFSCKSLLKQHLKIHARVKPFSCHICTKTFTHRHHLTGHVRRHTGERPFRCSECGQRFAVSCDLKKHSRVHENAAFPCSLCGAKFSLLLNLNRHKRKMHESPFAHLLSG